MPCPRAGLGGDAQRARGSAEPHHPAVGNVDEEQPICPVEHSTYRRGHFERSCRAAGLVGKKVKDLRDSFASHLLSAGIPLAYVSKQLGHASVAVTSEHYAKWASGDEYVQPPALLPGELPCDLLARLSPPASALETAILPPARPPRPAKSNPSNAAERAESSSPLLN